MISAQSVEKLHLSGATPPGIWVIGDLMLDRYVFGRVDRISPEAPVPVVRIERIEERPGGAANVALNVSALGGLVALGGAVGDDEPGRHVRRLVETSLKKQTGVLTLPNLTTTLKERAMAGAQQLLRIDHDCRVSLDAATIEKLIDALASVIAQPQIILLSDYQKGVVTPALIAALRKRLPNVPIYADPKGSDFTLYRGASLLKPNEREASLASGVEITNDATVRVAAEKIAAAVPSAEVIITRGNKGMIMLCKDGTLLRSQPSVVRVYDVVGAGDTALAALAVARATGLPFPDALHFANIAASIAVTKVGAIAVHRAEVLAALSRQDFGMKVVDRAGLAELRRTLTALGKKLVFTNGCFDILHVGHRRLLQAARAHGDVLIVAINSDASVRRLKGAERPVVGESDRAEMLSALEVVDYVTVFDEDTPLSAVVAAHPDVLVKGGDYTVDTIVGAKEVTSWGGRVEIVPLVEGKSTTRLIAALKK